MKNRKPIYMIAIAAAATAMFFQNCAGNYNPGAYTNQNSVAMPTPSPTATAPISATGQNCVIAAGTQWTVGGNTCVSGAAVTIVPGAVGSITTAATGGLTGTITYSCSATGAPLAQTAQAVCVSTAAQVSVGLGFSCAVKNDGTPECWGVNASGELGVGATSTTATLRPAFVSTALKFIKISSGGSSSCGVTTAGAVYCWGSNVYGQIGPAIAMTTTTASAPQLVSGLSAASDVKVGAGFACALTTAGNVYCWGDNSAKELASPTITTTNIPTLVPGLSGIVSLDVSRGTELLVYNGIVSTNRACAVNASGSLYCWGFNPTAVLNGVATPTVTLVSGVPALTSVSVGQQFNCGVTTAKTVVCWGDQYSGELGNAVASGAYGTYPAVPYTLALSNVSEVASGPAQSCAVYGSGQVACWGANWISLLTISIGITGGGGSTSLPTGQLGLDPNVAANEIVATPHDLGVSGAVHVSVGVEQTCFSSANNVVQCLGYNGNGQLGNGGVTASYLPVPAVLQ